MCAVFVVEICCNIHIIYILYIYEYDIYILYTERNTIYIYIHNNYALNVVSSLVNVLY